METLKKWREAEKLTVPQAAERVGVKRATWWRWENGVRPIGLDSLERVAAETGVPAAVLRPDLEFVRAA
jgi:transcriptional regulator with XRE-family HTH domain